MCGIKTNSIKSIIRKNIYAKETNYGTYFLVGQEWTTESGNRVLKCLYRHDMKNKIVTIQYNYPCIPKIVDIIKK